MYRKTFAVIGLGRFGSSVARTLSEMGNEVLAIDADEEKVQALADTVTQAVQADGTDENVLKSLGIRNFDVAVVAIGSDIQSSILTTLILKELGVKFVVSKATNELHGKVLYKAGADKVVFPERDSGIRIAHNLTSTNIVDYIELAPGYSIVEVMASENLVGKTLLELNLRPKFGVTVLAIKKKEKIVISPGAWDTIDKGDILFVVGEDENISKLENY